MAKDDAGLKTQIQQLEAAYLEWYGKYATGLGHYFRNLYRIVKFVHESDVANKQTYIGILRAQLSVPELGLLFDNMVGPGREKFLPLIVRYELLQNLPDNELWGEYHDALLKECARRAFDAELLLS